MQSSLLSEKPQGQGSRCTGPQERSSSKQAVVIGEMYGAGQSFYCMLQRPRGRDHQRLLSPFCIAACAEGQHLTLEFMQQDPAGPWTPSFPTIYPIPGLEAARQLWPFTK